MVVNAVLTVIEDVILHVFRKVAFLLVFYVIAWLLLLFLILLMVGLYAVHMNIYTLFKLCFKSVSHSDVPSSG